MLLQGSACLMNLTYVGCIMGWSVYAGAGILLALEVAWWTGVFVFFLHWRKNKKRNKQHTE